MTVAAIVCGAGAIVALTAPGKSAELGKCAFLVGLYYLLGKH